MMSGFGSYYLEIYIWVLEGFTNDVWLWLILSIDLVPVTFYTIPTSIYFLEKSFKNSSLVSF